MQTRLVGGSVSAVEVWTATGRGIEQLLGFQLVDFQVVSCTRNCKITLKGVAGRKGKFIVCSSLHFQLLHCYLSHCMCICC